MGDGERIWPSTSSMLDATMKASASGKENTAVCMDQKVTMSQYEFDEKTHQEFKDGVRHGMNLAIERLSKAASNRFLANNDDVANALRTMAESFQDDKKALPFRDFRVRPFLGHD